MVNHARNRAIRGTRRWFLAIGIVCLLATGAALGIDFLLKRPLLAELGEADLARVGRRFFRNECGEDPLKLTHWNRGEAFISLGILHMLWYPAGQTQTYRQTFPDFVRLCLARGEEVPPWIVDALAIGCPWPDRTRFYHQFDSPLAGSLRAFLKRTKGLQVAFAHRRLVSGLAPILSQAGIKERIPLAIKLFWLSRSAGGAYALIDYVNFKGEGLDPRERYQGEGWGLRQVLRRMALPTSSAGALKAFVASAKAVLSRRVANAPDTKKESSWLPGWHKRLDTYLEPT
jgi:hypothetical protein